MSGNISSLSSANSSFSSLISLKSTSSDDSPSPSQYQTISPVPGRPDQDPTGQIGLEFYLTQLFSRPQDVSDHSDPAQRPSDISEMTTDLVLDSQDQSIDEERTSKVKTSLCLKKKISIFSVFGKSSVFQFDAENQKITKHACDQCVSYIEENDLSPIYSVPVGQAFIIFAKNKKSGEIQQFAYNNMTEGLEQVVVPDVVFNPYMLPANLLSVFYGTGERIALVKDKSWKKIRYTATGTSVVPPFPVKTMQMKESGNEICFTQTPEAEFSTHYCKHNRVNFIKVIFNGKALKFAYKPELDEFEFMRCPICSDSVTEKHLFPKYGEYCENTKQFVIHCFNSKTQEMGKYVFEVETMSLREVRFPKMVYDPALNVSGQVISYLGFENSNAMILIKKDHDGHLIKEGAYTSSPMVHRYPEAPVKTFAVQKEEYEIRQEANKKNAETEEGEIQMDANKKISKTHQKNVRRNMRKSLRRSNESAKEYQHSDNN